VIDKQRSQIEELEERRQQIEMMLQWRDELANVQQPVYDTIVERYRTLTGFVPNELGMIEVRKWVKKFSLDIILESIDDTISKYGIWKDGKITVESWSQAFNWVAKFSASKVKYGSGPDLDRLLYIQGIIRNRVNNRWFKAIDDLKALADLGYSLQQIEDAAKTLVDEEDFDVWVRQWRRNASGSAQ
jgi:hypothetical protein